MASQNWPVFEKGVIAHEGSKYTDGVNPYDPGGPTRWGITLTDARLHWKKNATADDVKTMPLSVAIGIYKSKYWDKVRADELPGGVDYSTADYGVNSGVGRAGKVLRRLLALPDNTSTIDATVLAAVAKRDPKAIVKAMNEERLRFLQTLKIWPTYKNGWSRRVAEVLALSLKLADAPATAAAPVVVTKTDDTTTIAKGMIPEPKATKNIVKGSAPTIAAEEAARDGHGWLTWIMAHQVETAVIVVCVAVCVFAVIKLINDNHRARQEAPTPGLIPVPELPTA